MRLKHVPVKNAKHRRGIKPRMFARDYAKYEGCWGSGDDPHWGKREEGRDRWIRCHYCGEYVKVARAAISHIVAACMGGSDELENLVLAHDACNNEEGRRYNQLPGGAYPEMMGRTDAEH